MTSLETEQILSGDFCLCTKDEILRVSPHEHQGFLSSLPRIGLCPCLVVFNVL